MVKRIRFGFIAVSLSALLIIILVNVHALWDVGDDFNFTGDGRDDVEAISEFFKKKRSQRADIYDSVAVLEEAPDTLTSLKFDWKISDGHRLKGTLPFNKDWRYSNHWYTYRYPMHKDFTLELTPTCVPAVATFTKTAEAHHPWLPTDIIFKLFSSLAKEKAEVGGELAFLASNEKIQIPEVGMTPDEPDAEEYKNSEDPLNTPLSDEDQKILHVYSTIEEGEEGKYAFKYWAVNNSEYSISGDWTTYYETIEESWDVFEFTIEPNDELLLDEFESKGKPLELNGVVKIEIYGKEFIFFAPAFSAEEEEEETRVHNPEGQKKEKVERK